MYTGHHSELSKENFKGKGDGQIPSSTAPASGTVMCSF